MIIEHRKKIIGTFLVLAILSCYFITQLRFSFSFEQFFPQGDEELKYFQEFIEEFETDDNFLMVAIENKPTVFDSSFITKADSLHVMLKKIDGVKSVQSLLNFGFPVKTPFGISSIPAIHKNDFSRLKRDSVKIFEDPNLSNYLITSSGDAINFVLKTEDYLGIEDSKILVDEVELLLNKFGFEDNHILGRAYFMDQLSDMQFREVMVSSIVSIILVSIILFFLYRRLIGILIALLSIALGLLLFMGLLGFWGRELNAIAAIYPVLMLIVGTSDVVHIMSKYVDELRQGKSREESMNITIRQIGWATLLTSLTTSAGFLSLLTSKLQPIKDFGLNSAIGVMVAYLTVIFLTTTLLTFFPKDKIIKYGGQQVFWDKLMTRSYYWNRHNPIKVLIGSIAFLVLCFVGISKINTNYKIESNLPIGQKITEDFKYFEKELGGFRPMEFAITVGDDYELFDPKVITSIDKIEDKLLSTGKIRNSFSIAGIYKSINRMEHSNSLEYYKLPSENSIRKYKRYISKLPKSNSNVLISKDKRKTRISAKIFDMGADSVKVLSNHINDWIDTNIDSNILTIRQTGTGVIVDKNAEYLRVNLLQGLTLALFIVSMLMMILFRDFKFWFISLVPNLIPLLFAAAILGYFGIELEATISIVFAIVFGIAVDDTIHFLSKYKLAFAEFGDKELALKKSFEETGKAIVFTSIILFFGFLVMLFSVHPPSVTIGVLISVTLISALLSDLMIIPWLIRKFS